MFLFMYTSTCLAPNTVKVVDIIKMQAYCTDNNFDLCVPLSNTVDKQSSSAWVSDRQIQSRRRFTRQYAIMIMYCYRVEVYR